MFELMGEYGNVSCYCKLFDLFVKEWIFRHFELLETYRH